MDANDRNRRDAAGVGPYGRERDNLVPMSSLTDWRIAKGEPDIRGWEVRTVSGRQLGTVVDLLVDRAAGEAVMLDVDVPGADRHALVPIRVAHIDRQTRVILMDSAEFGDGEPRVVVEKPAAPAREIVVDRRPAVEQSAVRRSTDGEGDVVGFHATPAEPVAERRQRERRRIDRMGTDL
jgi:hypothetical protein